jgi:excisionase family DNA binding protein
MVPKPRLQRRSDDDRRQIPDRRNGLDRRLSTPVDEDFIFNTQEACDYLKISRPTFLNYISAGKIKAQKIGKGWKVFKAELDRFAKGS